MSIYIDSKKLLPFLKASGDLRERCKVVISQDGKFTVNHWDTSNISVLNYSVQIESDEDAEFCIVINKFKQALSIFVGRVKLSFEDNYIVLQKDTKKIRLPMIIEEQGMWFNKPLTWDVETFDVESKVFIEALRDVGGEHFIIEGFSGSLYIKSGEKGQAQYSNIIGNCEKNIRGKYNGAFVNKVLDLFSGETYLTIRFNDNTPMTIECDDAKFIIAPLSIND